MIAQWAAGVRQHGFLILLIHNDLIWRQLSPISNHDVVLRHLPRGKRNPYSVVFIRVQSNILTIE